MEQLTREQLDAVVRAVTDYAYFFDPYHQGQWISERKLRDWLADLPNRPT